MRSSRSREPLKISSVKFKATLELKNVTSVSQHVRVNPPSTSFFSIGLGTFSFRSLALSDLVWISRQMFPQGDSPVAVAWWHQAWVVNSPYVLLLTLWGITRTLSQWRCCWRIKWWCRSWPKDPPRYSNVSLELWYFLSCSYLGSTRCNTTHRSSSWYPW